jgi:hypothetical protein
MTTTDIAVHRPPADTVPAEPTVLRLHNPWTARLVVGSAVAVGALLGTMAGVAVFDAEAFDAVAGVAFLAAVLVTALAVVHNRFEKNPPDSAFVPADPA